MQSLFYFFFFQTSEKICKKTAKEEAAKLVKIVLQLLQEHGSESEISETREHSKSKLQQEHSSESEISETQENSKSKLQQEHSSESEISETQENSKAKKKTRNKEKSSEPVRRSTRTVGSELLVSDKKKVCIFSVV